MIARRLTRRNYIDILKKAKIGNEELTRLRGMLLQGDTLGMLDYLEKLPAEATVHRFIILKIMFTSERMYGDLGSCLSSLANAVSDYSAILHALASSNAACISPKGSHASCHQNPSLHSYGVSEYASQWHSQTKYIGRFKQAVLTHDNLFCLKWTYCESISSPSASTILNESCLRDDMDAQDQIELPFEAPPASILGSASSRPWRHYIRSLTTIFGEKRDYPIISIIVPTFNPKHDYLIKCLNSAFIQQYPSYEVVLIDDGSDNGIPIEVSRLYAENSNFVFSRLTSNSHITAATNLGISLARGDYVCFLDHDDELSIDALAVIGCCLLDHPSVDFFYSDEAKINEFDKIYDVFKKPAWSPCYLMSCGYTAHFSVYKKEYLEKTGLVQHGYDGAQDYFRALTTLVCGGAVAHIPRCLYYWREHSLSTALSSSDAKPYAFEAAKRALNKAIQTMPITDDVTVYEHPFIKGHTYMLPIIKSPQTITIVIPASNRSMTLHSGKQISHLNNLVNSIENSYAANHLLGIKLIIVCNSSIEPRQVRRFQAMPECSLVMCHSTRFDLAEMMNHGAETANSEYLVFMSDATEVITPEWLSVLLGYLRLPGVGCVAPKLIYSSGAIQHAGISCFGAPSYVDENQATFYPGHLGRNLTPREVTAVSSSCIMLTKSTFDLAGGFPIVLLPQIYRDTIFCNALSKKKLSSVVVPSVHLFCHAIGSRFSTEAISGQEAGLPKDLISHLGGIRENYSR